MCPSIRGTSKCRAYACMATLSRLAPNTSSSLTRPRVPDHPFSATLRVWLSRCERATELDVMLGNDRWKKDPRSHFYDYTGLQGAEQCGPLITHILAVCPFLLLPEVLCGSARAVWRLPDAVLREARRSPYGTLLEFSLISFPSTLFRSNRKFSLSHAVCTWHDSL